DTARAMEMDVAAASSPEDRQAALLRLALLYFANGFGNEAMGVLRVIEDEDPDIAVTASFAALKGGVSAIAGHYEEALALFSNPLIQQHPEIRLWTGFVAAASEQWRKASDAFPDDNA